MGNQPSRKTTKRKSSSKRPLKIIRSTKKSIKSNAYRKAAQSAIGGGLKASGSGVLAVSVFAGIRAYNKVKTGKKSDIQQITSRAINQTIKSQKLNIPKEGRTILRSSINTALTSKGKK